MNRAQGKQVSAAHISKRWLSSWLDRGVLLAVRGYQCYVSPHKGYACAHRVLHGGPSCSEYFRQAVKRHGSFTALTLLEKRFADCHDANRQLRLNRKSRMSLPQGDLGAKAVDRPEEQKPPQNRPKRDQHVQDPWFSNVLDCCFSAECEPTHSSGIDLTCLNGNGASCCCDCGNLWNCGDGCSCGD